MQIADEHIIEEREVDPADLRGETPGVHLHYNDTDPETISDGIDGIAVIQEADDIYRIDYWGYAYGRMLVAPSGVEELAANYLDPDAQIPSYTIDPDTVDTDDPPWWLPAPLELDPQVTCQRCQADVSVQQVVTPTHTDLTERDILCRECWNELRYDDH
jgi:hypothetical protein